MIDRYEAVIFDMDGVVTDTAGVHFDAWKQVFDDFLRKRDPTSPPFDLDDYQQHVDGRARLDGVTTLLRSRSIELPVGRPGDATDAPTAWGLANRKNHVFTEAVQAGGVRAFGSTLEFVGRLRSLHVLTAVVTASRNARSILAAAGAADLFDVEVDGVDAEELGLAGKPDPSMFLEAARRLGLAPGVCVVVEDALSGVEAGRQGRFGLVIGVDRHEGAAGLLRAGADVVVDDLAELADDLVVGPTDPWILAYRGVDPISEGTREALLTLGNGYFATRGAMAQASGDSVHHPGTYVAGVYNRLTSVVDGRATEDESMVNLPNWLPVDFRVGDGSWFSSEEWAMSGHRVALDLRTATLTRQATATDPSGRLVRLVERRIVSMADPHLAALELRLTSDNWSGELQVRSAIDTSTRNDNVMAHRMLADRHFDVIDRIHREEVAGVVVETSQSRVRVVVAQRTSVRRGDATALEDFELDGLLGQTLTFSARESDEIVVEKVASIVTSRDHATSEPFEAALRLLDSAPGFDTLAAEHTERWFDLWDRFFIDVKDGQDEMPAVRLHLLHLLQTLSQHTIDLDVGVPARGLHGEAYRGHIFWDDMLVFPLLDYRLPELARALLLYRSRRLPEARRAAAAAGARGARFPWQSGSDGREETPTLLYNPRSGRWIADHSRRQSHVNLAVAYNVWQYWQITADLGYLVRHGAELLVESARFFADIAVHDPGEDRFDLRGVMGPDEFHDGYPDRPGQGIDNNAYMNVMASWALARAKETFELLGPHLGSELWHRLDIDGKELDRWDHVSRRLRVPFLDNGLLAQFEGFGKLDELDWASYRSTHGNIGLMDLILEAEGDNANRYQVTKQADVLMLFYLFTADELVPLFERLGYEFDPASIPATVDHYLDRTTHGSTLSRVVHAWVLARTDRAHSWELFKEALRADVADTQGGTTREGIHLGAMAGSIDVLQRCYTGMEARDDTLWFNPLLPDELSSLDLRLRYRNQMLDVHVGHDELTLVAATGPARPVTVAHAGARYELRAGGSVHFPLGPPRPPQRPLERRKT